ncbi:MAG: AprI/Inh family metalloprotease inhibitor [Rhizobiaceae bacterium]
MGSFGKSGAVLLALAAMTAAGCSSSRLSALDTPPPAPLAAAPSGTVTGGQLPPPSGPNAAGDPAAFPPPPGTDPNAVGAPGTTTVVAAPPATAPDLTAGSVAGVWNASVQGQSCKVATPQTKFGAGFRAGPLRCPAPLDGVKSWNVAGKQLTLYDESGGALARLYSSGAERFDGQTQSGMPVSLTR